MVSTHEANPSEEPDDASRRDFVHKACTAVMIGGLASGYGALAAIAGRFLFPAGPAPLAWAYVGVANEFRTGDSLDFKAPNGQALVITRTADEGTVDDFIALSSVCPHLGCMVHWEPQRQRYFCPCHNGAFDPGGVATEGPPFQAGQALARFPLQIEGGLLYVQVPLASPSGSIG